MVADNLDFRAGYTAIDELIIELVREEAPCAAFLRTSMTGGANPKPLPEGRQPSDFCKKTLGELDQPEAKALGLNDDDFEWTKWTSFRAGRKDDSEALPSDSFCLMDFVVNDSEGNPIGFREEEQKIEHKPQQIKMHDGTIK